MRQVVTLILFPSKPQPSGRLFYTNAPGKNGNGISLVACAPQTNFTISPSYTKLDGTVLGDPECGAKDITVSLPYNPIGTVLNYTNTSAFACTDKGGWTEEVTVSFEALDSSWYEDISYTDGTPTTPPVTDPDDSAC